MNWSKFALQSVPIAVRHPIGCNFRAKKAPGSF
ncbi:MAG: hypothetical protein H6R07_1852 [Proteobacteria bacterium]|nr:hypothetical protein [Pseudomonadota bacterium]